MGLPYGEEIMIVCQTVWTQSTSVTDRRTGRQMDGQNYFHKDRATRLPRRAGRAAAAVILGMPPPPNHSCQRAAAAAADNNAAQIGGVACSAFLSTQKLVD